MNCIIVDDEPLARQAVKSLIANTKGLNFCAEFSNVDSAESFLNTNTADLIFLDIEMPGINGLAFAKSIPKKTLIIFTTAYAQYALDSYEVDAIDYLLKPVKPERFHQAVYKAISYKNLLESEQHNHTLEEVHPDYCFVKADRKVFKVLFNDIQFIEGLKDYVILHTTDQKIVTPMNVKTIYDQLPEHIFFRSSRSYIVNKLKINSFDNNTIYIDDHEIPIGDTYRQAFFDDFVNRNMLSR